MSARDAVEALERDVERLERKLDRAETKIERACKLLRLYADETWVTEYPRDALAILEGRS